MKEGKKERRKEGKKERGKEGMKKRGKKERWNKESFKEKANSWYQVWPSSAQLVYFTFPFVTTTLTINHIKLWVLGPSKGEQPDNWNWFCTCWENAIQVTNTWCLHPTVIAQVQSMLNCRIFSNVRHITYYKQSYNWVRMQKEFDRDTKLSSVLIIALQ